MATKTSEKERERQQTTPRVKYNSRTPRRLHMVLVSDMGGTNMKMLATGKRTLRKAPSGPTTTPRRMVEVVHQLAADWPYHVIALGFPGAVANGWPVCCGTQESGQGMDWV